MLLLGHALRVAVGTACEGKAMTTKAKTTRRRFLVGTAVTLAAVHLICCSGARAEQLSTSDEIVVTLLGTGSPEPSPTRFGPATLVPLHSDYDSLEVGG